MESQEQERFLSVAETLARKAGNLCLELQQNLGNVKYKSVKDVVTIADVGSEKLIVDGLAPRFPPIPSAQKRLASSRAPIPATAGLSTLWTAR